ncbi:hypothetical protein CDD81_4994 [Ophiocordyceps australis]|uniref:CFEM domain-containing protein n=1 Tax=Ophiocordyceps australis TaxID=1399860 RepID=A0A2C5XA79_9HYPO|nr:hypothetical protein CDD81_4994 [Ophiocordyceps australis]
MRAPVIAALTATVAAAGLDYTVLPACAKPCFTDMLRLSGCSGPSDAACLCESTPYVNYVSDCIPIKCQAYDILNARGWAHNKCRAIGHALERGRYT